MKKIAISKTIRLAWGLHAVFKTNKKWLFEELNLRFICLLQKKGLDTENRWILSKERIKKEGSTNCWMKKRFMMKLEIIRLNCVWTKTIRFLTKTIRFQRKKKSWCNLNIHTFLTDVWLRYGWKTLMKLSEKASNVTKNRFLTVNDYNFERFDSNSNSSRCFFCPCLSTRAHHQPSELNIKVNFHLTKWQCLRETT